MFFPGTLGFYFWLITVFMPQTNAQLAAGCYYNLNTALVVCPAATTAPAPARSGR